MEEVRDGVSVVGEVPLERLTNVSVDVLKLQEQQGNAVHEADYVCAPTVEVTANP